MSKRFIDYYLDAVTKKEGSGGGGGDTPTGSVTLELNGTYDVKKKATAVVDVQGGVASYADPVTPSGYTEYTPKENQYVTQSDIANLTPGDSTFQRQFPVDTVVAKGDKAAFVGTVRNTTAEKYCIYGTVTYTAKFSSYVNIRIAVEGVIVGGRLAPSNVISKNGVHDVMGRNSVNVDVSPNVGYLSATSNGEYFAQDGGYDGYSQVSVNVPSTYAPSSAEYAQIADYDNMRAPAFLEAVYANPAEKPFENITLHNPPVHGGKVIINGEVGDAETYAHQGEYYLWGVVDSYDESTAVLTLSAVEGMSYTGVDTTTGDGYARTIFTQNAEYANGTHRINVNVQGGGGSATLIDKNINANGTYNASSDSADGYKKVVVNVPNPSSGSLSITKNGTYDVTEKASAVVNVPNPSSGSLSITENGTYDVTEKASAVVNVQSPGSFDKCDIVYGTFSLTGAHLDNVVNIPYTGDKKLVKLIIQPIDNQFYEAMNLTRISKNAMLGYVVQKMNLLDPTFTGSPTTKENSGFLSRIYKNSTTTVSGNTSVVNNLYNNDEALQANSATARNLRIESNTSFMIASMAAGGSWYAAFNGLNYEYYAFYA